jgi:hypothetical protein
MGILNSDLIKTGVDVLNKFLDVLNKATGDIDGIGGSLIKITTVFGIFKLGSQIFNKFRAPMVQFFADVVKEAGLAGEKSMKEFDQKARAAHLDS